MPAFYKRVKYMPGSFSLALVPLEAQSLRFHSLYLIIERIHFSLTMVRPGFQGIVGPYLVQGFFYGKFFGGSHGLQPKV